jgi:environmental stress-induced protein Ves
VLHRFDIASLPSTPWKNGGGSTREIVCRPEGADMGGFDWRVSIATIAQAGPFSAFPAVDRVIMLLDGDGVQLQSTSGINHRLDQAHVPFAFSGDVALGCTLLGGVSNDFNVMTRRGALHAEVQVLRVATDISARQSGLLMVLRGNWQLTNHRDADASAFVPGQGFWWDAVPHGWRAVPRDVDAALVWVRLSASIS